MKYSKFIKPFTLITALSLITVTGSIAANAAVINDESTVMQSAGEQSDSFSTKSSLPSKYSSVEQGNVTSVKTQQYNDCWAYAGIAAFESKLLADGFTNVNMTMEHLNAWATTRSNSTGWLRNQYDEGYAEIPLGYFTSWSGAVLASDVADIDFYLIESGDEVPTNLSKYGATAIEYFDKTNPDAIKEAIMENGGVYSSFGSNSVCYNAEETAYYMPEDVQLTYIGHAIEVVGWDDNYAASNFNTQYGLRPKKAGAWLCKNSWGNYNSLGGYFWISYYDKYIFSDLFYPSYTINSVEQITDDKKLMQNEIYGATYEFNYLVDDTITYANKFTYDDNYKTIDKVIFETEALGADYIIYYAPNGSDGNPDPKKSNWTKLYSGTVDYKGYICADIDDFYVPDESGSIAITIDTSSQNIGVTPANSNFKISTIGVGEWLKKSTGEYIFKNDSQPGESYIIENNKSTDLLDWYKTNLDDPLGGTFVIKAVTLKSGEYEIGDVDKDGTLTISDATMIQKYIAQYETFDDYTLTLADFNGDNTIDIGDATAIQKSLAGMDS